MEWEQLWQPSQNSYGPDGNLYSKKGLGVSLLVVPLFTLGKWLPGIGAVQLANLTGNILAFLTLSCFFRLVLVLGYPTTTAFVATVALALATPLWIYSRTLLSEPLATLGCCVALYGAVALRRSTNRSGYVSLVLCSSGLALMVLAKSANAIAVLAVAPYVVYSLLVEHHRLRSRWRRLALVGAMPIGLSVLLTMLYNYSRFQTLLTFPLDPKEQFSTPLVMGLSGLLVSSGKGLFWYVPLVWLGLFGVSQWRKQGRLADYLLASSCILAPLWLYSQWYDWYGGRAWGPRMILFTVPAVVLLAVPALGWLTQVTTPTWKRMLLGVMLALSLVVQLPGVLVNFDLQEAQDLLAGVTPQQIVWDPLHSPLLTYWEAIGSETSDPIWLHAFFWQQPKGLLIALALAALLSVGLLTWSGTRLVRKEGYSAWVMLGQVGTLCLFAGGLVLAAQGDPRWQERTTEPEYNQALLEFVQTNAHPADIILFDLIVHFDMDARSWFWMNHSGVQPQSIFWRRRPVLSGPDQQLLQTWLQRYGRIWLALEGTPEGVQESTTEQWLNRWAFVGRRVWLGDQRVVEYGNPLQATRHLVRRTSAYFGDLVVLDSYTIWRSAEPELVMVELVWSHVAEDPLNVSVQAVSADGSLIGQLDQPLGEFELEDQRVNRVVLSIPNQFHSLILKAYRVDTGSALPVISQDQHGGDRFELLNMQAR
jgi:hypothetical protein